MFGLLAGEAEIEEDLGARPRWHPSKLKWSQQLMEKQIKLVTL